MSKTAYLNVWLTKYSGDWPLSETKVEVLEPLLYAYHDVFILIHIMKNSLSICGTDV